MYLLGDRDRRLLARKGIRSAARPARAPRNTRRFGTRFHPRCRAVFPCGDGVPPRSPSQWINGRAVKSSDGLSDGKRMRAARMGRRDGYVVVTALLKKSVGVVGNPEAEPPLPPPGGKSEDPLRSIARPDLGTKGILTSSLEALSSSRRRETP